MCKMLPEKSVTAPLARRIAVVLVLAPGLTVPPALAFRGPTVPLPPRVPPAVTSTPLPLWAVLTKRVPLLITVGPVYVLEPVRKSCPPPILAHPSGPKWQRPRRVRQDRRRAAFPPPPQNENGAKRNLQWHPFRQHRPKWQRAACLCGTAP